MSWRWVDRRLPVLLHDECLAAHGGASGIRDAEPLESALARPENLAAHGSPNLSDLGAAFAFGLASGEIDEPIFARRIRESIAPR